MAWLTGMRALQFASIFLTFQCVGPGIYHGSLNLETEGEDHIDTAALLPYPTSSGNDVPEVPLSLNLTEFHFILLYRERVVGICNLDDRMTYEETLPLVCRFSCIRFIFRLRYISENQRDSAWAGC